MSAIETSKYRVVQVGEHDFRLEHRGLLWGWNRVVWMNYGDWRPKAFPTLDAALDALQKEVELDEAKKFKVRQVWPTAK